MDNKVVILMATYNGEKYLREQINSLLNQKDVEVEILVRDDGSTDQTIQILNEFSEKGILVWYSGKRLNAAKSFLNLLMNAPVARYYALCDQDDVWEPEKLSIAINKLKKYPLDEMNLYYSGLKLVDENLNFLSEHKLNTNRNLLSTFVTTNMAGCTCVFNKCLLDQVNKYEPNYPAMHDSWIYRVCVSLGGNIIRDENSYINYRQHSNNVVGLNPGIKGK